MWHVFRVFLFAVALGLALFPVIYGEWELAKEQKRVAVLQEEIERDGNINQLEAWIKRQKESAGTQKSKTPKSNLLRTDWLKGHEEAWLKRKTPETYEPSKEEQENIWAWLDVDTWNVPDWFRGQLKAVSAIHTPGADPAENNELLKIQQEAWRQEAWRQMKKDK